MQKDSGNYEFHKMYNNEFDCPYKCHTENKYWNIKNGIPRMLFIV